MGTVIAAFSEEHAQRLTGITQSQLRYWDRSKFFLPSFPGGDWSSSFGRVYSFRDIVALRVLNVLRNQYQVPLQHLRVVSEKLAHLADKKWTGVKLYVLQKKVIWEEPGTDKPQEIVSGQYVVPSITLDFVVSDTKEAIQKALNARREEQLGQVEKSRFVNHNDAVISGTRIRVSAIKRFSDAGYSVDQILKEYPDLTQKDIASALDYSETRAAA